MPSAITHALVGAATAQLIPADVSRCRAALVIAAASAAPDLDVIGFRLGIPYSHILGHRGLSHSLACAAVLALIVTLILRQWCRRPSRLTLRTWLVVWTVAFVGIALHGVLDAATDAGLGVGLLIPLTDHRLFLPFRPIATSPVNPLGFLNARALHVLASEALWVWLPVGLLSGLLQTARWWRRRSLTH